MGIHSKNIVGPEMLENTTPHVQLKATFQSAKSPKLNAFPEHKLPSQEGETKKTFKKHK